MSAVYLYLLLFPLAALALLIKERITLAAQIRSIRCRVNVNGTRGKSTVTRLLTAALAEAGIPVVGKATGAKSCLISAAGNDKLPAQEEIELYRRPEGPNIKEIKLALRMAGGKKAGVLVAECMAVDPDYQKIYAQRFLQCNYSIITNVLDDHLEVLGPTRQDMAEAFMAAVPAGTSLIVRQGEFVPYYLREAQKRNITVRVANPDLISWDYCRSFSFPVFPENVALALEAALALGVSEKTALAGMLRAIPDPGAIRFQKIKGKMGDGVLINAFSANDPTTAMAIWEFLCSGRQVNNDTTVVMNCRGDRTDRARLFLKNVLNNIPAKSLILVGEGTGMIYAEKRSLSFAEVVNLGGASAKRVARFLLERCRPQDVFLGIGNYLGSEEICRELGGE